MELEKQHAFYSVVGLTSIESGKIIIDEKDVTDLPMYRRARLGLGYLPQESSIFRVCLLKKISWQSLK